MFSITLYLHIFRIGWPCQTKWRPVICSTPKDCQVTAIQRVQKLKELMKIVFPFFKGSLWQTGVSNAAKNGTFLAGTNGE